VGAHVLTPNAVLHIAGEHPGGIAVDYGALAVIVLSVGLAFYAVARLHPAPRPQSQRSMRRATPSGTLAVVDALAPQPLGWDVGAARSALPALLRPWMAFGSGSVALSYLFLLILGIQGFHVIEHIVLVVQIEAFGLGLAEAHGLLGARVDFEWLHFWYNLSFLVALVLLLVFGPRGAGGAVRPARWVVPALLGAALLQSYHVGEHTVRMVQYYRSDCTPCLGLIGQVVPFFWPHLFFGLIAYLPMVAAYFAFGLHRPLLRPSRLSLPSSRSAS
jgi:hypothetical protein